MQTQDLCKYYHVSKGFFRPKLSVIKAVDGVSISVMKGETLGLVGESGCGKTTVARTIIRVTNPTSGRIFLSGKDVSDLDKREIRNLRRQVQIVFQDPYSSLNPRMRIKDIVGEPLTVHLKLKGEDLKQRVASLLEMVGLSSDYLNRYPHQFSGGQRQRIAIARAIATTPELLMLDEPTSALDVSVQAQILALLGKIQRSFGLTYLFISHNLSVVRYMSERIAVMYRGRIVETGRTDDIFEEPLHPYTKALLAAIPMAVKGRKVSVAFEHENPEATEGLIARGCSYRLRCPLAMDMCKDVNPRLVEEDEGHLVSCHLYKDGSQKGPTT